MPAGRGEKDMQMTELEMLDALADAITRLGDQRDQLAAALNDAERRLGVINEVMGPRIGQSRPPRSRRKTRSRKARPSPAESTIAEGRRTGRDVSTPGKRQALGKTLKQMRDRPRREQPTPFEDNSTVP
jgi:hypothetical protein